MERVPGENIRAADGIQRGRAEGRAMTIAERESLAVDVLLTVAARQSESLADRRDLRDVAEWLRENTDGMRQDPDGTPLEIVGHG
jgi:hypothetical protein